MNHVWIDHASPGQAREARGVRARDGRTDARPPGVRAGVALRRARLGRQRPQQSGDDHPLPGPRELREKPELPETDRDYRRWVQLLEGEPEWTDVSYGDYIGKQLTSTATRSSGPQAREMSIPKTLQQAIQGFHKRVEAIADNQWLSPTPCTEWDVRALVNHVVGELRWIPPLLAGRTIAEVGDQFAGDLLGNQPKRAWTAASQQAIEASLQPGAMERTVHLSSGDHRADAYISEVATDAVIHTWDLARGIGADDRLDRELVDFAQATLKPQVEAWRAAGAFARAVDVPQGADAQTQFLALVGRRSTG